MITIKLWGGVCNQMFQYAFGYALAKNHNDILLFDIDFYTNQPEHVGKRKVMGKDQFPNISLLETTPRPTLIKPFENKYISHLIRYNCGCCLSLPGVSFMMEKLHHFYNEVPYKYNTNNYYDGYWQTGRYFIKYIAEIRHEFTPSDKVLSRVRCWRNGIAAKDCVAVHIRRGDYLNKINQGTLHGGNVIGDVDYYLRAIIYMQKQLDNPTFCFFSDDIQWCKETFSGKVENALFVENNCKDAAMLDLFSIAQCEHGIMSPSTFSWWGNWLRDPKKNSIVIGPKGNHSNKYFIDGNWIKI